MESIKYNLFIRCFVREKNKFESVSCVRIFDLFSLLDRYDIDIKIETTKRLLLNIVYIIYLQFDHYYHIDNLKSYKADKIYFYKTAMHARDYKKI